MNGLLNVRVAVIDDDEHEAMVLMNATGRSSPWRNSSCLMRLMADQSPPGQRFRWANRADCPHDGTDRPQHACQGENSAKTAAEQLRGFLKPYLTRIISPRFNPPAWISTRLATFSFPAGRADASRRFHSNGRSCVRASRRGSAATVCRARL